MRNDPLILCFGKRKITFLSYFVKPSIKNDLILFRKAGKVGEWHSIVNAIPVTECPLRGVYHA